MTHVPASRGLAALVLGILGLVGLLSGQARAAFDSSFAIMNCSNNKVRLCVYDKTDMVMKVTLSTGDLGKGEWLNAQCNSDGGCKVKIVSTSASCASPNSEESFVGATQVGENSYRLRQDSPGKYSFYKVSDDRKYFNDPSHRSCTATAKIGGACSAKGDCLEGFCAKGGKATGVCCVTDCDIATCQSCSSDGRQCTATPYGQNGQYCDQSWQMCDGSRCVWRASIADGKACVGNLECKSGFCADGVCCTAACDGTCMSCNLAGQAGTCAPVGKGQKDTATCGNICDGAGTCQFQAGHLCRTAAECVSGQCIQMNVGRGTPVKMCR